MKFSYFDHEHYSKVRLARQQKSYPHLPHSRASSDISLLGKTIVEISTGKSYTVDKVVEHWYLGWYRVITMIDSQGSHAVRYVENINTHADYVLESIEDFKKDCKIED